MAIPGKLNIFLAVLAYVVAIFFLWLASHSPMVILLCSAIGFSFIANTIFSLLHESVHGIFHKDLTKNNLFGCISAAFFPTGFTFQKICHLGHHRRNRTDAEMFDYYYSHDNKFIKFYRLYGLLTGFYWLVIPMGCLLYLFFKNFYKNKFFKAKIIKPLGFEPMVNDFIEYPEEKIRLEIVFTIIFQISLFHVLDISILGSLTCYIAFAINWCALQYTDHAWSKRDIKNGAWNLKINKTIQYVFLNYHLHLAHHQNPKVSWLHLPNFVDFSLNRPSFWKIYLSLWKGPKLTSEPPPGEMDAALERQLFE